ncbi:hypothetical protein KDH_49680 [Dictyobacter sp. S3.2.2.5]|uniref:Uncharacterized protein n=1 Tax=Dictyobacter halimunensis TaxID=3026934 RepID=A0ABQ6FV36_9CHLR|nr:hypothetical protein KDH_49680 [Dictyobacter sp. S3.2.2.5]
MRKKAPVTLNAWAKDRIALDKFPLTGIQFASHKISSKWGYTINTAHTNSIYRRAKKLFLCGDLPT